MALEEQTDMKRYRELVADGLVTVGTGYAMLAVFAAALSIKQNFLPNMRDFLFGITRPIVRLVKSRDTVMAFLVNSNLMKFPTINYRA